MTTIDDINATVKKLRETTNKRVTVLVYNGYYELKVENISICKIQTLHELEKILLAMDFLANSAVLFSLDKIGKESHYAFTREISR